jgi:FSR family fosmidomycin resistance protein-like MFS transporter
VALPVLLGGLAVELADELVDGAKGAALPLIRHDLGLSYAQVGLLASVPLLVGGVLELPLGLLAGEGRRRRLAVLGGGLLFVATVAAAAAARSFAELLCAFVAFYPASGAFVSLTQAELMDAWPDRQAQVMARWDLAGSVGAVSGPLLLAAVLAAGGGWRDAYLVMAGFAAVTWLGRRLSGPAPPARGEPGAAGGGSRPAAARVREVVAALRDRGTLRWLILIEVGDLLLDVFTGFVAVYLVDVAHAGAAFAALAVAVRLGATLAGDAALIVVLERAGDLAVLRVSAGAAALLYPAFLLAPGLVAKLVILAALSAATAPWYPLLQARLYGSLPGRSPVAVTLSTAAGLAGGLGPLAVGVIAQGFGLSWALAGLAGVPLVVLAGCAMASRALPAGGAGQQPAGAQRDLQLEPAVRVPQLVAEQLVDLPQPVPHGLRVDVHPVRHLGGVLAELQPGQQRLGDPVLLAGPQPGQRREAAAAQRPGQVLVGQDEQRGQVLVAADRRAKGRRALDGAAAGEGQRPARPAQRDRGAGQRHRRADRGQPAGQRALDHRRAPGPFGVGHQQARLGPGPVGQHVRRHGRARRSLAEGGRGNARRERPAGRAGQGGDELGPGRRVRDDRAEQGPAAALELALGVRPPLGVRLPLGESLGVRGGELFLPRRGRSRAGHRRKLLHLSSPPGGRA